MTQSPVTVQDILKAINNIASFSLAESWDNVGLLVGDPSMNVSGILIALDPTSSILKEALELNANIIITHHPIIFRPIKSMRGDHPQGRLLTRAIKDNIAIIGCHTNLDLARGGVNDVLADELGLTDTQPFPCQAGKSPAEPSFGRIGRLSAPISGADFLQHTMDTLKTPAMKIAGALPEMICQVAVCGGSGSDLAEDAFKAGSDIFLTSEVKHSVARWAEEAGHCIIDGGHFPTENIILPTFANALKKQLNMANAPEVHITSRQQDVFTYFNHNKPPSIGDIVCPRQP